MSVKGNEASETLERDAATVLGYMLFEYSRLDMELGLLLVWAEEGRSVAELSKSLNESNFNRKLDLLSELVESKYAGTIAEENYAEWLSGAHSIRALRNQLFHGRWGIAHREQRVANVIGLPTSPNQREVRYSVSELQESLETMKALRSQLASLRNSWPV